MFSINQKIRYSEVDKNGKLKLTNILDYMQDTSTFDTDKQGHDVNTVNALNYAWVILEWQIEIIRIPKLYENIKVVTYPYNFKSFLGYRNYYIEDENNEIIIKADSTWALVDTSTKKAIKIDRNIFSYDEENQLDMKLKKDKFWKNFDIKKATKVGDFYIDDFFIDTNGHMNNSKYLRIIEGYCTEIKNSNYFRIVYKKAILGNTYAQLYKYSDDSGYYYTFLNEELEACVFIYTEFL